MSDIYGKSYTLTKDILEDRYGRPTRVAIDLCRELESENSLLKSIHGATSGLNEVKELRKTTRYLPLLLIANAVIFLAMGAWMGLTLGYLEVINSCSKNGRVILTYSVFNKPVDILCNTEVPHVNK